MTRQHQYRSEVLTLDTASVINNTMPLDLIRKRGLAIRWMWFNSKPLVTREHHLLAWKRCNSEVLR